MATPEFQSGSENDNQTPTPEFPLLKGKTPEQLRSIARATGRTVFTGKRSPSGSPISLHAEIIGQMMERNKVKADQERSQNG